MREIETWLPDVRLEEVLVVGSADMVSADLSPYSIVVVSYELLSRKIAAFSASADA